MYFVDLVWSLWLFSKALKELGLIDKIGDIVSEIISSVEGESSRLAVAIVLILWVSAFASSFIDNIPYTTAMVSLDDIYKTQYVDFRLHEGTVYVVELIIM